MKVQIVLDTNVIIAALRSRNGASFEILRLIGENTTQENFQINLSVPLVLEYETVIHRHRNALGLTRNDVDALVGYLCEVANQYEIYYLWRPYLSDPKDDMVLEVAVAGQVDYIVTHNVKDFKNSDIFGVIAITPASFLTKIAH